MDKNKIKLEAKEIMNNFMKSLKKQEVEEEFILERENSFREESIEKIKIEQDSESFKQRFLSNANKTKGDAILANKGDWVE